MDWTTDADRRPTGTATAQPTNAGGVCIATLAVANAEEGVAVTFHDLGPGAQPVTARSTIVIDPADVGQAVLVLLEEGDPARPIIVGVLQDQPVRRSMDVVVDGTRLSFEARDELTLQAGTASIRLTKDGRVVIKGMEIVSRARGTHKVKGATVLIN